MINRAMYFLYQDPRFIEDISDYCDRWCERCPLTSRCFLFAAEAAKSADAMKNAEDDVPAALDSAREEEWNNFHNFLEMIECTAKEWGVDGLTVYRKVFHKNRPDWRQAARKHELSRAAKRYTDLVSEWIERTCGPDEDFPEDLLEPEAPFSPEAGEQMEIVTDAVEVIFWHQARILVMLVRGLNPGNESKVLESDPIQNFANGYVKVALLGIEGSILAWNNLLQCVPSLSDGILPVIETLEELKKMADRTFPHARQFVRPGFDDGAGMVE